MSKASDIKRGQMLCVPGLGAYKNVGCVGLCSLSPLHFLSRAGQSTHQAWSDASVAGLDAYKNVGM